MTGLVLWFVAWDGCDCTDVQPTRAELPDTCPCHGGRLLGKSTITESPRVQHGHQCTLPQLSEVTA